MTQTAIQKEVPWLSQLTTEVVRDAVLAEMGGRFSPTAIHRVAHLFSNAVYNFVRTKGKESDPSFEVPMTDFKAFTLMCRILDRIEKTIPVAGNLQVTCNMVTRDDLQGWIASRGEVGEAD